MARDCVVLFHQWLKRLANIKSHCNGIPNHHSIVLINRGTDFSLRNLRLRSLDISCSMSVTGEFPTQRASNVENVSIWCHHGAEQQFPRYRYFKIWPWKFQNQDHGWGQRTKSHCWLIIESMHFLFVSRQSDQRFQIYSSWYSFWLGKNRSKILNKNSSYTSNRIP